MIANLKDRLFTWVTVFGLAIASGWVVLAQTLPPGCKEALGNFSTYAPSVAIAVVGALMKGSKKLLVLLATTFFLSSCTLMPSYQATNMKDWIEQNKQLNANGCLYIRGNSRPYADVSMVYVAAYGAKAPTYKDCLEAIPDNARSLLHGN